MCDTYQYKGGPILNASSQKPVVKVGLRTYYVRFLIQGRGRGRGLGTFGFLTCKRSIASTLFL